MQAKTEKCNLQEVWDYTEKENIVKIITIPRETREDIATLKQEQHVLQRKHTLQREHSKYKRRALGWLDSRNGGGVQQKCGKIQYRKSPRKQNKKMENSGEKWRKLEDQFRRSNVQTELPERHQRWLGGGGIISQRNQEISPELKDGSFQIEKAHQDPRTMDETHPHQGWWLWNFWMLRRAKSLQG